MALTEIAIKALKPTNKIYRIAAEGGLYLEVNPNGSKYWRLKYRYAGKEKRLAIGVYPAISLKIAREKRDEAKKLIGDGIDPVAKRQEVKRLVAFNADNTFGAVAKEWFDTNIRKYICGFIYFGFGKRKVFKAQPA
ncbi:MAG: Arm DNA-binding domain-containing protein [Pseudomonadota bacterium]